MQRRSYQIKGKYLVESKMITIAKDKFPLLKDILRHHVPEPLKRIFYIENLVLKLNFFIT